MAVGLQLPVSARYCVIRLAEGVAAAVAANAIPTYASDGVDIQAELDKVFPAKSAPTQCVLHVYNPTGSGTVAATGKLWGGNDVSDRYGILGTGAAATAGITNGGVSADEVGTDVIDRFEPVLLPACFQKLHWQCTAISANTTVNADLIFQYAEGA